MLTLNTSTEQWLEGFWRDGYAVTGSILTPEELADYRCRFDALFQSLTGDVLPEVRDLSERRGRPLNHAMLQRVNLWTVDQAFNALAHRTDLLSLAVSILGSRKVRLFRDQGFYKPACHGAEVYMHQDNRYWHLDPPNAITVWIPLDDVTVQNGCVHYVNGSHRWGRVQHRRAAGGESILLEALADRRSASAVELRAGQGVVHHCLTVHYTPANITKRPRRAYSIQYMAGDVSKKGGLPDGHPILCQADVLEGVI